MSRTILVEGPSDQAAVHTIAQRLYADLDGLAIAAMGGVTNLGRYIGGPGRQFQMTSGLIDAGELGHAMRVIEDAGHGPINDEADLSRVGFFLCDPDLEAELIRSVGTGRILEIISAQGDDSRRFRSFQNQPEWRERDMESQLHRWFGSGAGRKIRYARLLSEAVDRERIPEPIMSVLEYVFRD